MNYPNKGKRKARKEAREKVGADLEARIKVFLDQGWPKREPQQEVLLKRLITVYNANFNRLPTQEEIMLILGKFLQEHGDHKDEKDYYPHLGEMVDILEKRTSEQGSPLTHLEFME